MKSMIALDKNIKSTLIAQSSAYTRVASSITALSHAFVEINNEIISTVILHPLIQEGLLSVTSEIMSLFVWSTG